MEAVPVTGFAANFSPMPRMAPPPLGKEIAGAADAENGPTATVSNEFCSNAVTRGSAQPAKDPANVADKPRQLKRTNLCCLSS